MCGIVAVYWLEWSHAHMTDKMVSLLNASRNRGQDGYGVAIYEENKLSRHVSNSIEWISEALKNYRSKILALLWHARYTTSGDGKWGETALQPFEIKEDELTAEAGISFAFNGNIVNAEELAAELRAEGFVLKHHPILDTEVLKLLMLREVRKWHTNISTILEYIHNRIDGCCNIILLDKNGNMAVAKDKWWFRPLVYGVKDGLLFVASESTALLRIGCENVNFISSGEIMQVDGATKKIEKTKMNILEPVEKQRCFFEAVYFADPKTNLWGEAASGYRYRFGQILGEEDNDRFDPADTIIVDIPSSSEDAAKWYADSAGIIRLQAITKHPDATRTFITEGENRKLKVKEKYIFNPNLKQFLKWKKVVLMDDSIVRGTTLTHLVQAFKDFYEPAEIHIRIPSPPVVAPCFYGINMADIKELIAANSFRDIKNPTEEELRALAHNFWATSLRYLSPLKLVNALRMHINSVCLACVTGDYPTACGQKTYDQKKASATAV